MDLTSQLYPVRVFGSAFLAVMPRPRAGEWVDEEFAGFHARGVRTILSLLEPWEAMEAGLANEAEFCSRHGMEFLSFPIVDRGVPADLRAFKRLVGELVARLDGRQSVAVHCLGGIGRAPVTAAATMVALGDDPATVFATITAARGHRVPDTEVQSDWFRQYAHAFQGDR